MSQRDDIQRVLDALLGGPGQPPPGAQSLIPSVSFDCAIGRHATCVESQCHCTCHR